MRRFLSLSLIFGVGVLTLGAGIEQEGWIPDFPIERDELVSTGRNPYFVLEPGYYLILAEGDEQLTITVLGKTMKVDGVETRVVEERKTKGGKLVEVSRNYLAMSKRTKDVFFFGEEVNKYKGDKVVSQAGSWLAGIKGAMPGLIMPGQVSLHARYRQEIAPRGSMDRAEIVSVSKTVKTPAGEFTNCLKVKEMSLLPQPLIKENLQPLLQEEKKYYAPGIGIVQDGKLKLVKFGKADEPNNKK